MALEPLCLALPSISPLPPIEMPDSPTSGSSVDSFVKRVAPKTGPRPKRIYTDLTMQVHEVQPSGSRDYKHHALQRNWGVCFSTQGDYNTSTGNDLNLEPWPSQRRASLKGKDSQLPLVRPVELKLPPRIPAIVSLTSSTSSISTTSSNSRDEYRRLHATTSMQFIPGQIANLVLASISGRAQSGSLGVKVDSGGKPISINTQISVTIFLWVCHFRLLSRYSPSPLTKMWIRSLLQWLVLPAQASPQSYARVLRSLASPISLSSLRLRACWVHRLPCVVC